MADKKTVLRNAICKELEAIAFANPFDFLRIDEDEDKNGEPVYKINPLTSDEIPDEMKKAIESVSHSSKGIDIKLHNKMKAIELLGKLNGFFDEKSADEIETAPTEEIEKIIAALEEKLNITHRIFSKRKEKNTERCLKKA